MGLTAIIAVNDKAGINVLDDPLGVIRILWALASG